MESGAMRGRSFADVVRGGTDEHRPFVVSSWPLYFAEGELTTAIDSRPRRISNFMPLTVTTQDRSLILGSETDEPELYDTAADPGEASNVWGEKSDEGVALAEGAVAFLEEQATPEKFLEPRRAALRRLQGERAAR
jgi:hypothetical protein